MKLYGSSQRGGTEILKTHLKQRQTTYGKLAMQGLTESSFDIHRLPEFELVWFCGCSEKQRVNKRGTNQCHLMVSRANILLRYPILHNNNPPHHSFGANHLSFQE